MIARCCAVLPGSTALLVPLRTLFSLGTTNDAFNLSAVLIIMNERLLVWLLLHTQPRSIFDTGL